MISCFSAVSVAERVDQQFQFRKGVLGDVSRLVGIDDTDQQSFSRGAADPVGIYLL
jgi:hypothetical protein